LIDFPAHRPVSGPWQLLTEEKIFRIEQQSRSRFLGGLPKTWTLLASQTGAISAGLKSPSARAWRTF
jgi:hypothetical protein